MLFISVSHRLVNRKEANMSDGVFKQGDDCRRNGSGRPPSSRTIAALVRRTIGRDAPEIIERLRVQAKAGDPNALQACASLLAATIETK